MDAIVPGGVRGIRMSRFSAGSRLGRLLVVGGVIAAGWLIGVIFGVFGPASADTDTASSTQVVAGSVRVADGFPAANSTAEAMAGRTVDGLTSQSTPGLPSPATAEHPPSNGMVPPVGNGSVLTGDVARGFTAPRLSHRPAPLAAVCPPVVRTAADDPSFSPD